MLESEVIGLRRLPQNGREDKETASVVDPGASSTGFDFHHDLPTVHQLGVACAGQNKCLTTTTLYSLERR